MITKVALDYIKNKRLKPAFSYKDVWNDEHVAAFTVAKAMQLDVLADIKDAVENAIKQGTTFEQFKKDLRPTLMEKGWWGKKQMIDPLTGKEVAAQLGSNRRLKTIYRTNLRSAYQKGRYDRTMASDMHPYLIYRIGNSHKHRDEHVSWNGLILPKKDPWWNVHFPPNGYGCNCYTVAVSETRKRWYENKGVPIQSSSPTAPRQYIQAKTTAPKTNYKTYYNERKGTIERIPEGITPGFNWNQGKPRSEQIKNALANKKYSGGSYGGIMNKSYEEQKAYAKRAYVEIRNRNPQNDIDKVSKSSKLSKSDVEKIRNHVFFETHLLNGKFQRFDEDPQIANAWEALEQGRAKEIDILLLKHELEELTIMKKYGYTYEKAHLLANKKYPWEYKLKGGWTDGDIQADIEARLKKLL